MQLCRIATDTPDYVAEDLRGQGARITGGRWNRPGLPMLYASTSIALACIETWVHLAAEGLPLNRYLVRLDVDDAVWQARRKLDRHSALRGWDALPAGKASLDYGDQWLQDAETALLEVPSVAIPEEHNVLLNPRHADAASIRAEKLGKFVYDARLLPSV